MSREGRCEAKEDERTDRVVFFLIHTMMAGPAATFDSREHGSTDKRQRSALAYGGIVHCGSDSRITGS